jgi:hypothetical protein
VLPSSDWVAELDSQRRRTIWRAFKFEYDLVFFFELA